MDEQTERQEEAGALLGAYGNYPIALQLKDDISAILPVEIISYEFFLLDPPPPWIEIVLFFASTTVATSVLSKMGEDIYTKLKSIPVGWFSSKKKKRKAEFKIILIVDGLRIEGRIPY